MAWSFKLGQVRGIGVYVHASFLLLLAWYAVSAWGESHNVAAVIDRTILLIAIFAIVVLHELGHAAAGQHFGVRTRDITLLPIGGIARMDRIPTIPSQELVIALAGPAVNLVLAVLLYFALSLTGSLRPFDEATLDKGPFAQRLLFVNISLLLFNLIPAFPLDGGRALRALLATQMGYPKATRLAALAGQTLALGLAMVGWMAGNPVLLLIGLFTWMGAGVEARAVSTAAALDGIPVRRAMVTDFRTLAPEASLDNAVDLVLAGSQRDFPVLDHGQVVGFLSQDDLVEALSRTPAAHVGDVMCRGFHPAEPGEMLDTLLPRLAGDECHAIPVVEHGRLLGMLTAENLAEFLKIREASLDQTSRLAGSS